jgi:hypothetical protein
MRIKFSKATPKLILWARGLRHPLKNQARASEASLHGGMGNPEMQQKPDTQMEHLPRGWTFEGGKIGPLQRAEASAKLAA